MTYQVLNISWFTIHNSMYYSLFVELNFKL